MGAGRQDRIDAQLFSLLIGNQSPYVRILATAVKGPDVLHPDGRVPLPDSSLPPSCTFVVRRFTDGRESRSMRAVRDHRCMPNCRHDQNLMRSLSLPSGNSVLQRVVFFCSWEGAIESSVDNKKGYRGNLELSGRHSGGTPMKEFNYRDPLR
jgi:hypothetical protein